MLSSPVQVGVAATAFTCTVKTKIYLRANKKATLITRTEGKAITPEAVGVGVVAGSVVGSAVVALEPATLDAATFAEAEAATTVVALQ